MANETESVEVERNRSRWEKNDLTKSSVAQYLADDAWNYGGDVSEEVNVKVVNDFIDTFSQ